MIFTGLNLSDLNFLAFWRLMTFLWTRECEIPFF